MFGEKRSAPYGHDVIYRLQKFDRDVRFHRGGVTPMRAIFFYRIRARIFNVFAYILETNKDFCSKLYKHIWPSCKTPEAGTGGCKRTARGF